MEGNENIATQIVWDRACEDARKKYLDNLVGGVVDVELVPSNPYDKTDWRYEEYEAAFEHYVMSLLGY